MSYSGLAEARSPRQAWLAVVNTLRPRQWIKNTLVIAAAGAAGALGHDDVPGRIALAFIAFCMLASGIYAVNDVRDAAEDRLHPRKRHRPVAAGDLAARDALVLGGSLMVLGIALCVVVSPLLGLVGAGYVALTLSYTLLWRHVAILDLFAIAGGFVLRAVAGGVAAPVALSRWFLLVVTFAAVFVAAGKRSAELQRTDQERATAGAARAGRRRVLELYTERRLRLLMSAAAFCATFAYTFWAFAMPTADGVPWRPLSIIPFVACLIRYQLVVQLGAGEAPDELILRDRWLVLAGLAWLIVFALGVHAAS
jgi:decaprenyl-phosphate phosphoribosyltransferase